MIEQVYRHAKYQIILFRYVLDKHRKNRIYIEKIGYILKISAIFDFFDIFNYFEKNHDFFHPWSAVCMEFLCGLYPQQKSSY